MDYGLKCSVFTSRLLCVNNSPARCGIYRASDFCNHGWCFLVGVQVSLFAARIGVSVVTRADFIPTDDILGKLREVVGEEVAGYIEAFDLKSSDAGDGELSATAKQKELFGKAYADLISFVEKQEKRIGVTSRELGVAEAATVGGGAMPENDAGGGGAASAAHMSTVPSAGKRTFDGDMVLETRQKGANPPQWAWVRRCNLDNWKKFEGPNSTAASQPAQLPRTAII